MDLDSWALENVQLLYLKERKPRFLGYKTGWGRDPSYKEDFLVTPFK